MTGGAMTSLAEINTLPPAGVDEAERVGGDTSTPGDSSGQIFRRTIHHGASAQFQMISIDDVHDFI
jgi:hypothetical protein